MFNNGDILNIDIVMALITQAIKKGDQKLSCVELVLELVRKSSKTILYLYRLY